MEENLTSNKQLIVIAGKKTAQKNQHLSIPVALLLDLYTVVVIITAVTQPTDITILAVHMLAALWSSFTPLLLQFQKKDLYSLVRMKNW